MKLANKKLRLERINIKFMIVRRRQLFCVDFIHKYRLKKVAVEKSEDYILLSKKKKRKNFSS